MNTYINTILTVSVVGGIINSIVPTKSKLKKYISYIVGLVCVLCLISPLSSLIINTAGLKQSINDFTHNIFIKEDIEHTNSLIINTGTEHVCSGIKEIIIDKYGFDENEVIVELVLDKTNINAIKINCVNVTLTGKASWSDAKTIEKYLNDLIGTKIEVKRR